MKPKNVPDKHKKPTLIYYGEKKIEAKSLIRIQVKNPNVGKLKCVSCSNNKRWQC